MWVAILNFGIDSIETNNEAGTDNRSENKTVVNNPGDQDDVNEVSVNVPRVLKEGNETLNVSGSVNKNSSGETGDVDRDWSLEAEIASLKLDSEMEEKILENKEELLGDETESRDDNLGQEPERIGNDKVETAIERDQSQGMANNVLPQHALAGENANVLVGLNPDNQCHQDIISDTSIGIRVDEDLMDANLPVSAGLVENTAANIEDDQSRNPNLLIEGEKISEMTECSNAKDVKHGALMPKVRGKENHTEKEGEYYLSDLVWGKVRSHPWWPGQIFEPSAASDKAMKYFKKNSYLVIYFGDQTFAWNDISKIKPFRMYFSQMEKQRTADNFIRAVDDALNEMSRRIESGLSCRCLQEEVLANVNSQVVASAGIREESRRICGADSFTMDPSFFTENLVNYLKSFAKAPDAEVDRLELVKAKAQVFAFKRWKRCLQLPIFEESDEMMDNDADPSSQDVSGDNEDYQFLSGKAKSTPRDRTQKKHLMELVSGSSSFPNVRKKTEGKAGRKSPSGYSGGKPKVIDALNGSGGKKRKGLSSRRTRNITSSLPRKRIRIGDRVRSVAGKLGELTTSSASSSIVRTSEQMLSDLVFVAKNLIEGSGLLISVVEFFSDFRNSVFVKSNNVKKKKKSSGKQNAGKSRKSEIAEAFKSEPETHTEKDGLVVETETVDRRDPNTVNDHETNAVATELNVENPSHMNGQPNEHNSATTLILNFTDLQSVPPITELHDIFSSYGPINESETEILNESKCVKVVFNKRSDAEDAFSSTGKFNVFGPSLVSYRLKYTPAPRRSSTGAKRRKTST